MLFIPQIGLLPNLKTKNVQAISEFLPCIQTILQNFKLRRKSTCLLNQTLEIMDMKPFCPTRMSYILSASAQIVNMHAPIRDVLSSADIKREERDQSMSPKGLIITHSLAELEAVF